MVNPIFDHCTSAKRVLRYLKGTIDVGFIQVKFMKDLKVNSYSDFSGDVEDRKGTLGPSSRSFPVQVFFLCGLQLKEKFCGLIFV